VHWRLITALSIALISFGCSDEIVPIQQTESSVGDVRANYVKILYGGAAGGVTYCLNLEYSGKREKCAIAAIHVNSGNIKWSGRDLVFTYCGGTITNDETGPRKLKNGTRFFVSVKASCQEDNSRSSL
jgi:hypothetical protein